MHQSLFDAARATVALFGLAVIAGCGASQAGPPEGSVAPARAGVASTPVASKATTQKPVSATKARVLVTGTLGVDTGSDRRDRADQVQVQTTRSRVALSSFGVEWKTGASAAIPPLAATEAVLFSHVYVQTVPDLAKPNDNPRLFEAELWIPRAAAGPAVALEVRPAISSLAVTLTTGTRPGLSFSGLPKKAVSLDTTTTGREGMDVITTGNGCKKSAQRQRLRYWGTNNPGRSYKGIFADPEAPWCHGYPRDLKRR